MVKNYKNYNIVGILILSLLIVLPYLHKDPQTRGNIKHIVIKNYIRYSTNISRLVTKRIKINPILMIINNI